MKSKQTKVPVLKPEEVLYDLDDTALEQGGVLRCCLAFVASEYEGKKVKLGDKSSCRYCNTTFTLVMVPPGMLSCYTKKVLKTTPVWKPDWQLKEEHGPQILS
jgi:hypothetical protein